MLLRGSWRSAPGAGLELHDCRLPPVDLLHLIQGLRAWGAWVSWAEQELVCVCVWPRNTNAHGQLTSHHASKNPPKTTNVEPRRAA